MTIKGLNESYLVKTKMTAEQIANEISDLVEETINTINILSAGWDAFFGHYAVIRTAKNRHWVVSNGEVFAYSGFAKDRGFY